MAWTLVPLSYLLGSVSFALLVGRAAAGVDIRTVGSGNAGATNVLRVAGWGPALLVLVLDVGKGAAPILVGRSLDAPAVMLGLAALAAVGGHVFPLFQGFRGGKGVATAAGALGTLSPPAIVCSAGLFLAALAWKRYVSLASVVAAVGYPVALVVGARLGWSAPADPALVLGGAAVAALIVWRHATNLRRLLAGEEPRLGERLEAAAR